MNAIVSNLFEIVVGSAMLLIFSRFMLEFAGIESSNPFAKVTFKLTRVVDMFGRLFPTIGQTTQTNKHLRVVQPGFAINTAALVIMLLLRLFYLGLMTQLMGKYYPPLHLFFVGTISLVLDFLMMCQIILFGTFIANLVSMLTQSNNPIWALITQLSEPILAPFRKILPQTGMFDFAFMFAYMGIYLVQEVVKVVAANLLSL